MLDWTCKTTEHPRGNIPVSLMFLGAGKGVDLTLSDPAHVGGLRRGPSPGQTACHTASVTSPPSPFAQSFALFRWCGAGGRIENTGYRRPYIPLVVCAKVGAEHHPRVREGEDRAPLPKGLPVFPIPPTRPP